MAGGAQRDLWAQTGGGERGEPGLLSRAWYPGVSAEEWGRMRVCRQGQPDAVDGDHGGECGLRLQPLRDDGAAGAQEDGHRGDGHHS